MTNTTTVPIFFSVDDGYVPCLAVALTSIRANKNPQVDFEINILNSGLLADNQKRLAALAAPHFKIRFIAMDAVTKQISGDTNKLRGDYVTLTIYFRLFIADMFPQYDKAIYIDADTVADRDLTTLFATNMGDHLFAGVADPVMMTYPETIEYIQRDFGVQPGEYINSGVLLMNLAQLRKEHFSSRFLHLLKTYHFTMIAADQDYINVIAQHRIKYLPKIWNMQTGVPTAAEPGGKLIHYNLFGKPWHYQNAKLGDRFWHYAPASGFENDLKQQLAAFTPADQQADRDSMAGMLKTAVQACHTSNTILNAVKHGEQVAL